MRSRSSPAEAGYVKAVGIERDVAEQLDPEAMVDFWYTHFNVFASKALDHLWIGADEAEATRPYALR